MSSLDRRTATAPGDKTDQAAEASCDAFLGGRIRALQPRRGPRAGIDALFLAAAVPARTGRGEKVLEAGTGTGIASLALAARVRDAAITGVEVQAELCALARRNAGINGWSERIMVVEADVTAPRSALEKAGLEPESFAHVMANPPFFTQGRTRRRADPSSARAHAAEAGAMEKWVRFLAAMAAPRGSVTIIHHADALGELLGLLQGRFGALSIFPLFPREQAAASRVVVQGIKGSRAPLTLARGLVLHEREGRYTAEAEAILREGAPLITQAVSRATKSGR